MKIEDSLLYNIFNQMSFLFQKKNLTVFNENLTVDLIIYSLFYLYFLFFRESQEKFILPLKI